MQVKCIDVYRNVIIEIMTETNALTSASGLHWHRGCSFCIRTCVKNDVKALSFCVSGGGGGGVEVGMKLSLHRSYSHCLVFVTSEVSFHPPLCT